MAKPFRLPRERNIARVLSIHANSVAKHRTARERFMVNPNVGSLEGRRDRALARRAQGFRVAFVRTYNNPKYRGIVRTNMVRLAARRYRDALKAWAANYDRASGWDAYVRANSQLASFPTVNKAPRN